MPISSTHPLYDAVSAQYVRCRDVIAGSDAVKNKSETYLPRLTGQSYTEYQAYKDRGLFFSVASRALSGLTGLASRRNPVLEYAPSLTNYFTDTSTSGVSFNELFIEMLNEVMLMSRQFVMVDFPSTGGAPYIVSFAAENAINWDFKNNVLQWVVLQEFVSEFDRRDPYKRKNVIQYRKLWLDDDGFYHVSVLNAKEKLVSDIMPTVKGQPIDFIPGIFITPNGLNTDPIKPAMLDIIDINLTHYRLMTDYLNALHVVAVPTPVFTGGVEADEIKMGPNSAIIMPEPNSKAFYLEFQGQGLKGVEDALNMLINQMALFSSRLTADTGKGSESAISVQLRYSSESATLSAVVNSVQAALTQIYNWVADFNDVARPVITLHKQFLNTKLTAPELQQYTNALLNGAIDQETYYNILFTGEIPVSNNVKNLQPSVLTQAASGGNMIPD